MSYVLYMAYVAAFPSFFIFLSFIFLPPQGIWSSQAKDQIRTAVATYTVPVATLDPLPTVPG